MKTDLEATKGEVATRSNEVRDLILVEAQKIDESYQSLARLLHESYDNGYYIRWGYESFKEYVETELGVQYRKAKYLVSIAQVIKDLKINWDEVEGIGWSKLRVLVPILREQGSAGDWLELAKQYSSKDLESLVKDSKIGFDIGASGQDKIVTLTFRMTPETSEIVTEALDTAKRVIETTDNVLALEQMSYDYVMSSDEPGEKVSLENLIAFAEKHYGVELVVAGREDIADMVEEREKNETSVGET